MAKWQYITEIVSPPDDVYSALRRMGAEGWEAWHIDRSPTGFREIFFKRFMIEDPWRQGYAAQQDKIPQDANPYHDEDAEAAEEWARGWRDSLLDSAQ